MPQSQLSNWDVSVDVSGPITIKRGPNTRPHEFIVLKGERNPFLTNVRIESFKDGVRISLIAHARSQQGASDSAAYFVGLALDVLGLHTDLPLYLNLLTPAYRRELISARRVIEEQEWIDAFDRGRSYAIERPAFSRTLSWYRKGLTGENPLDQTLAYWAALESIGSQFHKMNERTEKGTVNQICNCFDQLWGSVENWKVIANDAGAVDTLKEYRNKIAHGGIRADVSKLVELKEMLPRYRDPTRQFLLDWEDQGEEIEYRYRNEPVNELAE